MPVVFALQPNLFRSTIRFIKQSELNRVRSLRVAVREAMNRLELTADEGKNISGIPEGSDHFNAGDFVTWTKAIQLKSKRAVKQLIALDATIEKRITL